MPGRSRWKESNSALENKDATKDDNWKRPDGDRISYMRQGAIKVFVPKEGKNRVRLLEPREANEIGYYGLEVFFHREVGVERGDYLCNDRMKYQLRSAYQDIDMPSNCPICDKQTSELWDTDKDLAKTYYPNERVWFFVLDVDCDSPEEIKLWSCPKTLSKEIIAQSQKDEGGVYLSPSDPDSAGIVSFTRKGTGKIDTAYSGVQVGQTPSPISDEVWNNIPEFIEFLVVPTYEEVKLADDGMEDEGPPQRDLDDIPSDQAPPSEPEPEEPPCFQKDFGEYEDCTPEGCEYFEDCKNPPEPEPEPEPEPKKPSRPSRPSRPAKPAEPKKASRPSRPSRPAKEEAGEKSSEGLSDVRKRILDAKKKREEQSG